MSTDNMEYEVMDAASSGDSGISGSSGVSGTMGVVRVPRDVLPIATSSSIGVVSIGEGLRLIGTSGAIGVETVGGYYSVGGVRNGSEVTSADGLTPCPIVDGVPYYKPGSGGGESITVDALETSLHYHVGVLDLNGNAVKQGQEEETKTTVIDSLGNLRIASETLVGGFKTGYQRQDGTNYYPVNVDNQGKAYAEFTYKSSDTQNTVGAYTIDNSTDGNSSEQFNPIVVPHGTDASYNKSWNHNGIIFTNAGEIRANKFSVDDNNYLDADGLTCDKINGGGEEGQVLTQANGTMEWRTPQVQAEISTATSQKAGVIKVSSVNLSSVTVQSESIQSDRYYPIELNSDSKAIVNVPWTDTKNTAGSTNNTANKLFIIGSRTQGDNPQTYSNVNVYIQSNAVYASSGFFETSDENLKVFGGKVNVDLDELSRLKKNYFTWKDGEDKSVQIGVSAQEIQKLYPEIVSEQDNGTLTVAYDKLSVVTLAAIDKLYAENQELKARLDELENKIK